MKSKFLAVLSAFVVISFSSFASDGDKIKELAINENYEKIIVDRNINLVLVTDESKKTITVSGNQESVEQVEIKIKNGCLTISSGRNTNLKNVYVYVPVKNISYVELGQGASVKSEGQLNLENLKVFVNDGSSINLASFGSIEIDSPADCEFVYQKNEVRKVTSE